MRILLTNDDGIYSKFMRCLQHALQDLGHDVFVAAPEKERSAQSHAITLHKPLRVKPVEEGVVSVSGTPVDCVYVALHGLLEERPDLVISGVNRGYNLGSDVFYSGTFAAAMDGALRGIRGIALSAHQSCNPEPVAKWAGDLVTRLIEIDGWQLLNVNIPCDAPEGVDVTGLGARDYSDRVTKKDDPRGKPYYWIGGDLPTLNPGSDSDVGSCARGRASITPMRLSLQGEPSQMEVLERGLRGS